VVHALIVRIEMKITWPVGSLILAVALPILAGVLGCAQRIQGLTTENFGWIFMWSLPISIICVFMTGILCGLKKAEKIKGEVFRGLTVLTIFFSTVFSFWFLDQVSGV
jgi:hypothetical protein